MNNDSNILLINGQSNFVNISNDEKNEIKELINSLNEFNLENNDNLLELQKDINVENVKKVLDLVNKLIINNKIEENKRDKIIEIKKKILKITSPSERYQYQKSSFCDALEKGEWILIEHIESAPPEIIQKLIPLTSENPEIKIIQGTKEIIYKYKTNEENNSQSLEQNIRYIDPNFRIFFTYDPENEEFKINQKLLINCISFTLPENDLFFENSAQISYGLFRKNKYNKIFSKELAIKLTQAHQMVKEKKENSPSDFSGKMVFTGRTYYYLII